MSLVVHLVSDLENKKLSKEEIEKIFAKYTKHFDKVIAGTYKDKDKEEEEEEEESIS